MRKPTGNSEALSLPIKILGVAGSPRQGNTEILVREALAGAADVGTVDLHFFSFHKKRFEACLATCSRYCAKHGCCVVKDDFDDFLKAWCEADGVIFGAPVYSMGPPAQVKAALDRLGNVLYGHFYDQHPRFSKVCAAIVQGSSRWGGQEIALQFFVEQFLALSCVVIAGDLPHSYIGVAGVASSAWDRQSIRQDKIAMAAARNLGRRVAEMTRIVRLGMRAWGEALPQEYRFSLEMLGQSKRHYPSEGVYKEEQP